MVRRLKLAILLGTPLIRSGIEKIVGRYVVKLAKSNQVADGHFIGTAFISGIHGLGGAENRGNLRLGEVVVLAKPTEFVRKERIFQPPNYTMPILAMTF